MHIDVIKSHIYIYIDDIYNDAYFERYDRLIKHMTKYLNDKIVNQI